MTRFWLIVVSVVIAGVLAGAGGYWIYQHNQTKVAMVGVSPAADLSAETTLPSPSPSPAVEPVKLLFGGDLMFDRHIRLHMADEGVDFVLAPLSELFSRYDAVIANLEGPVTDNSSRSVGSVLGSTSNFIFTFDPQVVPMLKKNNLRILDLGNNHIANFGSAGITQTKQYLKQEGLAFFGNTGTETTSAERIHYEQFGPHKLAFVSHNQFMPDGFATALTDVRVASAAADIVVVMPHWGNEYQETATGVIVQQAHQLIDAGADVIIGGHPHVIQQHEDYGGKRIYYSLGNFVFDQYFSPEVQQGLLVDMEIHPDQTMTFSEIPIQLLKTGQTTFRPSLDLDGQAVPKMVQ